MDVYKTEPMSIPPPPQIPSPSSLSKGDSSSPSDCHPYDTGPDFGLSFFDSPTPKKEDFEEKPTCIYDPTQVGTDPLFSDCGGQYALSTTTEPMTHAHHPQHHVGRGLNLMEQSPPPGLTLLYDQKPQLPISKHTQLTHKPVIKADQSFTAADSNSSTPAKSFVPCKVCGDKASGYHYGVTSCEGCKGFFRRSIQKQIEYRCLRDGKCLVIRLNRNRCQYCRFKKCLAVGMSRDSVRYGRVPKRSRERNEEARVTQSEADQSAREMENKQLVIYDIILTISQAHHANCAYTEEKTRGIIRKPAVFSLNDVGSDGESLSPGTPDSLEQQKIVMWQHFAMFVTPSIQRVVEFAKRVPGFTDLSQDDQLILIKAGFFEIWLVHIARMFNTMDNTVTFNDGSYVTRQQMDLMFDHEFITALFTFAVTHNNMQLNDTEVGLFSAIVLLTSERPGLTDHKHIEQQQDKLMEALKLQVARNHADETHLFPTLLMKLPELRSLGIKHSEHLQWFRIHWAKLKLPPLFAEIFDIPKCEDDLQ